jgi:hypothetical protein
MFRAFATYLPIVAWAQVQDCKSDREIVRVVRDFLREQQYGERQFVSDRGRDARVPWSRKRSPSGDARC